MYELSYKTLVNCAKSSNLYGMSVTYSRWVHHGEAVNVNVTDYVEAAEHHLDLPDAQVEEEEVVVVAEPVSLTNIETML